MLKFCFVLLSILTLCLPPHASAKSIELHFIDVGEGDACLILTELGHSILVDTGNLITGMNVYKYLQQKNVQKLDQVFITHPHPDHMGGIFSLKQLIPILKISDNLEDISSKIADEDIFRWYRDFVRNDKTFSVLHAGEELSFGDLKIKVLSPLINKRSKDWNTNSLVLHVGYGKFSALLMGDGNLETEKKLLQSDFIAGLKNITLLKAGHHGAADTAGMDFLELVKPQLVVISVNSNNIRGYPAAQSITNYEKIGAKILRTDLKGNIVVEADKFGNLTLDPS